MDCCWSFLIRKFQKMESQRIKIGYKPYSKSHWSMAQSIQISTQYRKDQYWGNHHTEPEEEKLILKSNHLRLNPNKPTINGGFIKRIKQKLEWKKFHQEIFIEKRNCLKRWKEEINSLSRGPPWPSTLSHIFPFSHFLKILFQNKLNSFIT